jgi:hypothetical protein
VAGRPDPPGHLAGAGAPAPAGVDPRAWSLVRRSGTFATLPSAALQGLLAAGSERSFEAGDALVTQGDPPDGLLILLDGTAHARLRSVDATDRPIGRFMAGDVVGEMALVTREPRSATVVADSAVRALFVPTAAFDRLVLRHLELAVVLTELIADRLGRSAHDGFGGKKVEGFRILRCIGRGGMSVVYRAQDEASGEHVALKMMSYRLIFDTAALTRFHQEAAIVQGLDHQNIARLERLFTAYRTYFLVMELCDGVDLRRLVKARGPLPEVQVRPILGQLARALDYVHERGLVHRDLKPGNVMVTQQGDIKLTDFGLAVAEVVVDDQFTTAHAAVMGTPAYMAPEQMNGGALDGRADVYALGCLAYDLLTGRHLFNATSVFELIQQKLTVALPPAALIGEGISTELYEFMQGALRVNPDERPRSATSLVKWAARCEPPPPDLVNEP